MATLNPAITNHPNRLSWQITEEKVQAAIKRIASVAQPQAIVLSGSYVRGQAQPGSDLDVLVIVDDSVENCRAESVRLRRTLRGISMPMDIIVARRSDVERLRYTPGLLYETALTEGRLVYERRQTKPTAGFTTRLAATR